ncbi:MAG TPA: hypothetical protein VMU50_22075 [Polyangia bacterium]|nr:hypothetical protein [Polyangia bacterium]
MKIRIGFVILFASFFSAPLVRADELVLGESGHVALSVERLFGYSHLSMTTTSGGVDSTETFNIFSFLGAPNFGAYSIPRLAGDVFVARGFSLGLTGELVHLSASGTGSSDESGTLFQLAPRVGYLFHAAPLLAIWPRAGVTYERSSFTTTSSVTHQSSTLRTSLTAVTIEAPFALRLVARVALLIVPFADIGVGGSTQGNVLGSPSRDLKETEFGVEMGMLIFL